MAGLRVLRSATPLEVAGVDCNCSVRRGRPVGTFFPPGDADAAAGGGEFTRGLLGPAREVLTGAVFPPPDPVPPPPGTAPPPPPPAPPPPPPTPPPLINRDGSVVMSCWDGAGNWGAPAADSARCTAAADGTVGMLGPAELGIRCGLSSVLFFRDRVAARPGGMFGLLVAERTGEPSRDALGEPAVDEVAETSGVVDARLSVRVWGVAGSVDCVDCVVGVAGVGVGVMAAGAGFAVVPGVVAVDAAGVVVLGDMSAPSGSPVPRPFPGLSLIFLPFPPAMFVLGDPSLWGTMAVGPPDADMAEVGDRAYTSECCGHMFGHGYYWPPGQPWAAVTTNVWPAFTGGGEGLGGAKGGRERAGNGVGVYVYVCRIYVGVASKVCFTGGTSWTGLKQGKRCRA